MKLSLFGVLAVLVTAACSGNPKAEYEVAPACKTKLSLRSCFLLLGGLLPTVSSESRAVSIEYSRSWRIG